MRRSLGWIALLCLVLAVAVVAAACGDSGKGAGFGDGDSGADGTTGDGDVPPLDDGSLFGDGAQTGALVITPQDAVVDAVIGQPMPTVQFVAKTIGGAQVSAQWQIDRGEFGAIGVGTGLFTASGNVGGKATVTATAGKLTGKTSITVRVKMVQNGDPNAGGGGGGAGGNGGVGGEGPGAAVSQGTQQTLLGNPANDPGLAWLYPYDKTVWPRGILAPLLQWQRGAQNYDAVYIHLQENAFEYQGFFAKTATPFIHHPIPQAVWKKLGYSNQGEDVTVTLVFASGANAYGPITEKWKIAQGTLKGTVYYNSYGTNLASNYCCTIGNSNFGGATLAIKGGSTDPVLVAGNNQNCRVCHSVAASGSTLVTQQGSGYTTSSAYALTNGNLETTMSPGDGRFAWPALYPDGTFLLSNGGPLMGTGSNGAALYAVPSGAPIAATGLAAGLRTGTPAFSPDGKHVAYNFYAGAGADQKSLASMDFDAQNKAFSSAQTLYSPGAAGTAVWPSWLPTNDAIVFELETQNNGRDWAGTRSNCDQSGACSNVGTRAELWWWKGGKAHRLDGANGAGYVPAGPNSHDDDAHLNYEPTVNPVPSGGYAWIVFTSRRMYGNVATINPYWSDPRFHDISTEPTTKKLWVAAIDLNAGPDSDPSHPAFYLPAQELLAGNSRGFWVVDPCHQNGTTCETGDECCGGYCQPAGDGGLVCSATKPTCSQEFDKCTLDSDCCNSQDRCINGRCAAPIPK